MSLSSEHHRYLKERGTNPARLATRYCSSGSELRILYCDPTGQPTSIAKARNTLFAGCFQLASQSSLHRPPAVHARTSAL